MIFKKKLLGILVTTLFLMVAFVGGLWAADTVKIGVLAPMTGPAAEDGLAVTRSVEMAADMINSQGGILGKDIELVIYDDRADPKEAVGLAYKLIEQDRVIAVVGGSYSFPSRAVASIFQEEGIPFVAAYAIHPDITAAGDYCFRNGFLGTVEGKADAYVAAKELKAKTIGLLYADTDFGRTLADGVRSYLGKRASHIPVVYESTYPFKEKDFSAYLSNIKKMNPDVVIASGYYFQTGPMIKQAREMGITSVFIGEEGSDSPVFLKIAGPASEGFIFVTNLNREDPRAFVQDYLKKYEEKYGEEPNMCGASGYDALVIIADSTNRAKSLKGEDIKNAMATTENLDGLTGNITFNEIGEVVKPIQVQVVKDGKFKYFGVVDDPEIMQP